MSVQYYGQSQHLEPNTKYTVTIDLPGIFKEWSFYSQLRTYRNEQPIYCNADEVMQDLGIFAEAFTRKDVVFAIKDSSDRLEDFLAIHEIDFSELTGADLRGVQLAMKNYARYKAGVDLANQIYYDLMKSGGREAKRLGSLQIDRQGATLLADLNKIRQHLLEQFLYWEARLLFIKTGNIRPGPKAVVRGSAVSPYPLVTRTF